jgi:hypothetical protein
MWHSWRQRRFGLLVVEATSNKRLRCDFGMEGKLSGGGTIWHIIQVRGCDSTAQSMPLPKRLTLHRVGPNDLETSDSNLAMVNASLFNLRCQAN